MRVKFCRLAALYFAARQVGHKSGNTRNSGFQLAMQPYVVRQVEEKCYPYYRTLPNRYAMYTLNICLKLQVL